jgi:hypothetical protein
MNTVLDLQASYRDGFFSPTIRVLLEPVSDFHELAGRSGSLGEDQNSDSREITFEQFEELKKADRAALLALPPAEAQQAVDQILHPRLWRIVDTSRPSKNPSSRLRLHRLTQMLSATNSSRRPKAWASAAMSES